MYIICRCNIICYFITLFIFPLFVILHTWLGMFNPIKVSILTAHLQFSKLAPQSISSLKTWRESHSENQFLPSSWARIHATYWFSMKTLSWLEIWQADQFRDLEILCRKNLYKLTPIDLNMRQKNIWKIIMETDFWYWFYFKYFKYH